MWLVGAQAARLCATFRRAATKGGFLFSAFCGPVFGVEIRTQKWVRQVAQHLKPCRKRDPVFGPQNSLCFVPGANSLQHFFPSGDICWANDSLRGRQACRQERVVLNWKPTSTLHKVEMGHVGAAPGSRRPQASTLKQNVHIGPKTKTEAASSHLRLLCFQNLFNFQNRSKQTCFHCPSRALLMQRHGLISLLLECGKGVPDSRFAQAQYLHKKLQRAVNSPSYFPVSKKTTQAKTQRLWKERRQAFYTREPFFVVTLLPWAKALDSKHPARGKIL